tara:strand:+ start:226 stop:369 length:144 start_codon:yes stop_codon:yes gene_type:complete
MDEQLIRKELDYCLATEEELNSQEWKAGYSDNWPVERMKPIEDIYYN